MPMFKLRKRNEALPATRDPRVRIMLVDDEPANLLALSALLGEDYDILTADDGEAAYQALLSMHDRDGIALVISDQRMPRLTGTELLERLKALMPQTLRIVLTGYSDLQAILDALNRAEIYRYVSKPVDRDDMLLTVKRAVEAYQLRQRVDQTNRTLQHQALHDPLTGLPNRRSLDADLAAALAPGEAEPAPLAFLMMELDRFKPVVAGHGHAFGDELLVAAARRLQDTAQRLQDVLPGTRIYRFDGAVFAALLPAPGGCASADCLSQALIESLQEPLDIRGVPVYLNLKLGFALHPEHGTGAAGLMRNTDAAVSQAAQVAGSCAMAYRPEMNQRSERMLTLEQDLRGAARRGELRLFYQPQVDLQTSRLVGVEALLRWQHPRYGLVSPVDFIPLAETNGHIVALGRWVLGEACRQAAAWRAAGLPLVVAVNISAGQFHHPDFLQHVRSALAEHGLQPQALELEITESVSVVDVGHCIQVMKALRAMGLQLSIDDFGTGYSSLTYLKSFPLDTLKIDQSFVRPMLNHPDNEAIARTIVTLGHTLGLKVIAEGVETEAHLQKLRELRCDVVQGFHFARPLPAAELQAWAQAWVGPRAGHAATA
jgi:diguanylate cyclase (GGDEF)-like protein